jgi:hypothetical protein
MGPRPGIQRGLPAGIPFLQTLTHHTDDRPLYSGKYEDFCIPACLFGLGKSPPRPPLCFRADITQTGLSNCAPQVLMSSATSAFAPASRESLRLFLRKYKSLTACLFGQSYGPKDLRRLVHWKRNSLRHCSRDRRPVS